MGAALTIIITLLVTALVLLAIPGAAILVALYKAARAGQHSTPDKLRWMADRIEGVESERAATVEIDGAKLHANLKNHRRTSPRHA